ncbi:MAG: enoyl-CoA hydratase/isomerase family protein [Pyrinomonadaceae bacterium]
MSEAVLLEQIENKIVVRFNRPQIRSPLSIAVLEKLHSFTEIILARQNIETVIFTGTEDVFASGADLREIAKVTGETAREFSMLGQTLMTKIAAMPQATIAAINGFCFGGALDLALACDKRIASPNAVFSHPGRESGNYHRMGRNAAFAASGRGSKSIRNVSDRKKSQLERGFGNRFD